MTGTGVFGDGETGMGVAGTGVIGVHVGYVMKPTLQASQVPPVNPAEHVHVHEVLAPFDATDAAWLLQCVAVVHCEHVGYVMCPTLQASQVAPVNPVEQVQVHAVVAPFDVTDAAWLLQFFFFFAFHVSLPRSPLPLTFAVAAAAVCVVVVVVGAGG